MDEEEEKEKQIHEESEGDGEEDEAEEEKKSVDKSNVVAEITLATSSEDHTGGDDDEAEVDGEEDEEEEGEEGEEDEEDEEVDDEDDDEQSSEDDDDVNDENFHCDMTLQEIQQEIRELAGRWQTILIPLLRPNLIKTFFYRVSAQGHAVQRAQTGLPAQGTGA